MGTLPVNAMCVTPFDERDQVDEQALTTIVEGLAAAGVGVYLGSYGTGEGHLLRPAEVDRLYRVGVAAASGRVPVYAAALGFTSTDVVIEAALAAIEAGVDGVQIHPPRPGPIAIKPRPAELERFYADVLAAVRAPVLLTNQAVMVGYHLAPDFIVEVIGAYPQVVGVTTSDPDLERVSAFVDALGNVTDVFVGIISQFPAVGPRGARGVLCFEADVAPALVRAAVEGGERWDRVLALNAVLSRYQNPRSVKAAMGLLGLPAGGLRRPYLPLDQAEIEDISGSLRELGLLAPKP
jgi:4-hydroxy-tetrahydrodipicolinate synthase